MKFTPWSEKLLELPKNKLILAIDPGKEGWMVVVDRRGILCCHPNPVNHFVTSRSVVLDRETNKRRHKEMRTSSLNYTLACDMLRHFKETCESHGVTPRLVYETANPRPFQGVKGTVEQHLGIHMWPIICACLDIACVGKDAGAWKRKVKLTKSKSLSITRAIEFAPKLQGRLTDKDHDLAEAILLGRYTLTGEI